MEWLRSPRHSQYRRPGGSRTATRCRPQADRTGVPAGKSARPEPRTEPVACVPALEADETDERGYQRRFSWCPLSRHPAETVLPAGVIRRQEQNRHLARFGRHPSGNACTNREHPVHKADVPGLRKPASLRCSSRHNHGRSQCCHVQWYAIHETHTY